MVYSSPVLRIDRIGESILALVGELDLATSPLLDPTIAELASGGAPRVQLDCSLLEFVDSSGLSAFVHNSRDLQAHGRSLELVNVPDRFRRLFEICRLDTELRVHFFEASLTG